MIKLKDCPYIIGYLAFQPLRQRFDLGAGNFYPFAVIINFLLGIIRLFYNPGSQCVGRMWGIPHAHCQAR